MREGAELVNEPGAWAMSTLVDAPTRTAAAAFYGSVFGWSVEPYGPASLFRLPRLRRRHGARSSPSRATSSP